MKKRTAIFGLSAVCLFGITLLLFSVLNPNFNPLVDYVSKLGAVGQPYALWWNLIGFLGVGILLIGFGYTFGLVIEDRLIGMLLAIFGVGFAATAIPIEMADEAALVSMAHVVAICLGLAFWLFGLARMTYLKRLGKAVHRSANIAAILVVLPMFVQVAEIWPMPVTHRLVFLVVFGWVGYTSIILLLEARK